MNKVRISNIFMNPLERKILIFYKDEQWARCIFGKIIKSVHDYIKKYKYNKNDKYIITNEGNFIYFAENKEPVQDEKYYEIYLQEGIDEDFYNLVKKHSLIMNNEYFIIKDIQDLRTHEIKADDYYKHCK